MGFINALRQLQVTQVPNRQEHCSLPLVRCGHHGGDCGEEGVRVTLGEDRQVLPGLGRHEPDVDGRRPGVRCGWGQ